MLRRSIQNLFLVVLSLFLCFGLFELLLRTGLFDGMDNPHPVWIPGKYKKLDKEINLREQKQFCGGNSFAFKDRERSVYKKQGYKRIAVLGDSFIFGDGVPYDVIWSHKLENKISKYFNNIEVVSWGRDGWSTYDEYNFLKAYGHAYNIDMLIVGFVVNDLETRAYLPNFLYIWKQSYSETGFFPNVTDFLLSHLYNIVSRYSKDGYGHWEEKQYSEKNSKMYLSLLKEFKNFCRRKNIKLLFVLTPQNYEYTFRHRFDSVIPLFQKAGIEYLDLYPAIKRRLSQYKIRQLWANPANGHPGDIVTEVYADEVFNYLVQSGKIN